MANQHVSARRARSPGGILGILAALVVGNLMPSIPANRNLFRAAIMESNPLALPYPSLQAQVESKWDNFLDRLVLRDQPAPATARSTWPRCGHCRWQRSRTPTATTPR